jgi:uncharacterized membrane-anchored protein YitT (DUF2179 family)
MKKLISDILSIIFGALLFSLAVNLFVIPNEFGEGGVTGLTMITYYLYQWSPGIVSLILNALLLIMGYKFLDKTTTVYTIIAVFFNSLFLILTKNWHIPSDELIINAIFGGILSGVGIGLIIRVGGTTAGSTIIARILHKFLDWNVSYALLLVDLVVVFASYFIIGVQSLMFTIVMLYIATKVMDFIIEGVNPMKAVTIVSKEQDKIAEQVNGIMDRGVTVIYGRGYYSKAPKELLYIVISKQEVTTLKKIVRSIDNEAFITIHDVRDVFGEGFLELSK